MLAIDELIPFCTVKLHLGAIYFHRKCLYNWSALSSGVLVDQGSHGDWKTWKNGRVFSSQGILIRPEKSQNFTKNTGKVSKPIKLINRKKRMFIGYVFKNMFSLSLPGILVLIFTDLSVIPIINGLPLVTAHVCGKAMCLYSVCVSVCLCVCVCVCVCLSVWAITFECFDIKTKFLVWRYILTIFRSS